MSDPVAKENETKNCLHCMSPMPTAAKKCTSCGCWIGWRRVMNVSAVTLGILISTVAFVLSLVPYWKQSLIPNRANVEIAVIQWEFIEEKLNLVLNNSGRQPALINAVHISKNTEFSEETFLKLGVPREMINIDNSVTHRSSNFLPILLKSGEMQDYSIDLLRDDQPALPLLSEIELSRLLVKIEENNAFVLPPFSGYEFVAEHIVTIHVIGEDMTETRLYEYRLVE